MMHNADRDDVKQIRLSSHEQVARVVPERDPDAHLDKARPGVRARAGMRWSFVCLATAMTAGCGLSSSMTSGIGNGILGSGTSSASAPKGVNEEQLLHAAKSDGEVITGALGSAPGCPQMLIWAREKHLTVYEGGRTGDGLAIVHQGEITKVARECEFAPGQVTIKYGFSGRVLVGPKGQPGVVQLPVTAFVTDGNRERVVGETIKVDVSIPPDTPISYFSTVRIITIKLQEGTRPADYKLYVGFDKNAPEVAAPATAGAPTKRGRP